MQAHVPTVVILGRNCIYIKQNIKDGMNIHAKMFRYSKFSVYLCVLKTSNYDFFKQLNTAVFLNTKVYIKFYSMCKKKIIKMVDIGELRVP